jgi:hypothetical protein
MKYGEATLGQVEAVWNKLGGPEGVQMLLAGELEVRRVRRAWRTIKIGTPGLRTADDFRKIFKARGIDIGNGGNDILSKPEFTVAGQETELDLVIISVAELGFRNGARRDQIYDRAKNLGLGLCPAEVGPQLRLQYVGQPNGECLLIGMEPIRDSYGILSVFDVVGDGSGPYLNSHSGSANFVWSVDSRWVFVFRKSA